MRVRDQNRAANRWDQIGMVTDVMFHRQYTVRLDGSGRPSLRTWGRADRPPDALSTLQPSTPSRKKQARTGWMTTKFELILLEMFVVGCHLFCFLCTKSSYIDLMENVFFWRRGGWGMCDVRHVGSVPGSDLGVSRPLPGKSVRQSEANNGWGWIHLSLSSKTLQQATW